jgi:hypothetical protein
LNITVVEKAELTAFQFSNVAFLFGLVPDVRSGGRTIRLTTGSSGDNSSNQKSEDGEFVGEHCDWRDDEESM